MYKLVLFTTLLLLTIQVSAIDYKYVTVETLNIRENAGKQYNVVGKVYKGDKVAAFSESENWTQIETQSGLKGFVATKYLTNEVAKKSSLADAPKETGFKYGFNKTFLPSLFIIFLLCESIAHQTSKRIKDGRFRNGIKELPFTISDYLKYALYALIISLVISFFVGIYFWIKSF